MKKIVALLIVLFMFATPAYAATYPATMVVTEINRATNMIAMETATGHIYEMTGAEDYMVGDLVSLIMDDKGTADITDDVILDARYSGWWIEDDGNVYTEE